MDQNQFSGVLKLIVPGLVAEIMSGNNLSNHTAAEMLYKSELYAMLEKEESKLWHLSAPALYDLFNEELETGRITYPEEA